MFDLDTMRKLNDEAAAAETRERAPTGIPMPMDADAELARLAARWGLPKETVALLTAAERKLRVGRHDN